MRFGSLFAGIGGLDLGLERAGMECIWQVEIDDYCTKILEKHWPDVRRYRDVKEVGGNLEPVDLIAGGFPCQPHSVAGKRKGATDDRNLWPEFIRIIRETRPRYVLAENVPGIITTYLDTVLSDLEGEGYTCTTFNLPACGFDAPHRRERIFVVAYTESYLRGTPRDERPKSPNGSNSLLADANQEREPRLSRREEAQNTGAGIGSEDVRHTTGERLPNGINKEMGRSEKRDTLLQPQRSNWWTVEPDVGRVAHGIPSRMDRLRGLGNAVVPQVAQWIGERIIEHAQAN